MKRAAFAIALAAATPTQSVALSCLPTTVESAFTFAQEAEEAYVPVVGQIDDLVLQSNPQEDAQTPAGALGTANFIGHYVARDGRLEPFSTPVSIDLRCLASWCGELSGGADYLTFLRVDPSAYVLEVGPCYSQLIARPTKDQVDRLRVCMRDQGCAAEF